MPRQVIFEGRIENLSILDKDGQVDKKLEPKLTRDQLTGMYRLMVMMRKFDEKALNLQRQGRIGTYGSLRGQEAAQAGIAFNLTKTDWVVPSFREHGVMMALGLPMHLIYSYWKGDERGNIVPPDLRILPASVPVGSQLVHAAGLGMAMRLRDEPSVVVGFAGDGATSEGDFHEALNFAGVFNARTVFFIQNNQWAISVPRKRQTAAESIAQKALAYGIPGIQVDGNDVLAVYAASKAAVEHARSGKGASLIEAVTYRMGDHTTADDQKRYRDPDEIAYWLARDPIDRFRKYLVSKKMWTDDNDAALATEMTALVEDEVKNLESMPAPTPVEFFDHMYENLPWNLREQRDAFAQGDRT